MTDLITQLEQLHEKQLPLVLFNVHFTQSQTSQPKKKFSRHMTNTEPRNAVLNQKMNAMKKMTVRFDQKSFAMTNPLNQPQET